MPKSNVNVEPLDRQQQGRYEMDSTTAYNWTAAYDQMRLAAKGNAKVKGKTGGKVNVPVLLDAFLNGSLQIADENGTLTTVKNDYVKFLKGTEDVVLPIVQASLEGRLFVKDEEGQLRQMQATHVDPGFRIDVTRALERVPWAPVDKSEIKLDKPEKPGLWTRFVAALFKGSDAAKKVQKYEEALDAYNKQQQKLPAVPKQESREEVKVQAPKKEGELPETLGNLPAKELEEKLKAISKEGEEYGNAMKRLWFTTPQRTEAQINAMVLGKVRGQLAERFLKEAGDAENKEQYLSENGSKFDESLKNLKAFVHEKLTDKDQPYHKMIKVLAAPVGAKLGDSEKQDLKKMLHEGRTASTEGYLNSVEAPTPFAKKTLQNLDKQRVQKLFEDSFLNSCLTQFQQKMAENTKQQGSQGISMERKNVMDKEKQQGGMNLNV